MRFITPREKLEINSMEDADRMKRLPSVVIIQRPGEGMNEERAYLVESRNWNEYVRLTGGDNPDTVDVKEEAAKRLGYPIDVKIFEDAIARQINCRHFLDESAYSIYVTDFTRTALGTIPGRVDEQA